MSERRSCTVCAVAFFSVPLPLDVQCVFEVDYFDEMSLTNLELFSSLAGGSSASLVKSQEVIVLSADTEDERRDWIRSIKQVLYSDKGGG